MNARHYQSILAVVGLIIAMGIVGQSDYEEEQRQAEQYCKMVVLWEQTDGQTGWPAYDGKEVCRTSNVLEVQSWRKSGPGSRQRSEPKSSGRSH